MKSKNKIHSSKYMYTWKNPKHWLENIATFFRSFKWKYQRSVRGFSDVDVWNLDDFLLNLFNESLSQLAEHGNGCPVSEEFADETSWKKCLKDIAQLFYQAQEYNHYYPTEEFDKWINFMINRSKEDTTPNPYDESSAKETEENERKRQEDFKKAWNKMGEVFFWLWD